MNVGDRVKGGGVWAGILLTGLLLAWGVRIPARPAGWTDKGPRPLLLWTRPVSAEGRVFLLDGAEPWVATVEPKGAGTSVTFTGGDGREQASFSIPARGGTLAAPVRKGLIVGDLESSQIYQVEPRQGPSRRRLGAKGRLTWLAAGRNGEILAVAEDEDGAERLILNGAGKEEGWEYRVTEGRLVAQALSPSGRAVAVGLLSYPSSPGRLQYIEGGRLIWEWPSPRHLIHRLSFHPRGVVAAAGPEVYSFRGGSEPAWVFSAGGWVVDLAVEESALDVAVLLEREVVILDPAGVPRWRRKLPGAGGALAWGPEGQLIVAGKGWLGGYGSAGKPLWVEDMDLRAEETRVVGINLLARLAGGEVRFYRLPGVAEGRP